MSTEAAEITEEDHLAMRTQKSKADLLVVLNK